jgi:hypothetical protein
MEAEETDALGGQLRVLWIMESATDYSALDINHDRLDSGKSTGEN